MFFVRFKIKRLIKKLKVLQQNRLHNQPSEQAISQEVAYYNELAAIYRQLIGHKKYPFAADSLIACLRAAASLDNAEAQHKVGKKLLDEANFRAQLEQEGLFASPSNEREMHQVYEEAHAYLQAAENLGHIQARRLRGLCYINGWGITADKDKGFKLVIASIEQENSWDKITQIFTELGLNKPEFYSALTKHRQH